MATEISEKTKMAKGLQIKILADFIKMLHSLNIQLKTRHKATEYTKYNASKMIHYLIKTIKVLARMYVSIELMTKQCVAVVPRNAHTSVVMLKI